MSNNDPECAKTVIDEKTFKAWTSTMDPNSTGLRGDIANRCRCALCLKHAKRLKDGHNFSDAVIATSLIDC